jgi:hypothetical protein
MSSNLVKYPCRERGKDEFVTIGESQVYRFENQKDTANQVVIEM